jgi:NADH-quinone oxidoreductase subunit J
VLFMFVVMMLDINYVQMRQGFLQYLPIGVVIGLILLAELIVMLSGWHLAPELNVSPAAPMPASIIVNNTQALGQLLYTHYIYLFQAAGMILLVAMVGAIVLTHRKRTGVKKQVIRDQLARTDSVELVKVKTGKGI